VSLTGLSILVGPFGLRAVLPIHHEGVFRVPVVVGQGLGVREPRDVKPVWHVYGGVSSGSGVSAGAESAVRDPRVGCCDGVGGAARPGGEAMGVCELHGYTGTLVHWYTGTLVHWYTGTLVHWYTGTLVHWHTGTLAHWHTRTLVHRYTLPNPRTEKHLTPILGSPARNRSEAGGRLDPLRSGEGELLGRHVVGVDRRVGDGADGHCGRSGVGDLWSVLLQGVTG
jgi:hypothetical protein